MATRALATAFVNIVPGTKDMEKYLKGDLSKGASVAGAKAGDGFSNGFNNSIKRLIGPAIFTALGVAAVRFGSDAVKSASNLQAEFEGVNQVFGEGAKAVQEYAKQASNLAGITETEALSAAKNMGVFAKSAGLAGSEAAKFSIEMVQLAGDLGSFNDVPTAEALAAIQSGLLGQAEPLRRFGVLLDDATLRTRAMEIGLIKTTKDALTPQQKVLASYSEILRQTSIQQGDFVKYQDTFGNAIKTINSRFDEIVANIGEALIPALESILPKIRDFIDEMGPKLVAAVKAVPWAEIADRFMEIVTAIVENRDRIIDLIKYIGIFAGAVAVYKVAMGVATVATGLFTASLQINPIMAAITAISLLVVGIMELQKAIGNAGKADLMKKSTVAANKAGLAAYDKYLATAKREQTNTGPGSILPSEIAAAERARQAAYDASMKKVVAINDNLNGKIAAEQSKVSSAITVPSFGDGGVGSSSAKTAAATAKTISAAISKFQKSTADAKKKYDTAVTKANADFASAQLKINQEFDSKVSDLTKNRDSDLAKASADHASNVANIQKDFATKMTDIIQQSKDRLRSAFESVASINVGETFANLTFKNVSSLITNLKTKLTGAKDLITNAAALASAGFSQTFIESVVAQGPDAGNAMAQSILAATPESQAELQNLFAESETLANSGMDSLATAMYEKSGLATAALRSLYTQAQTDLTAALANEESLYTAKQLEIQTAFNEGIAAAKVSRDEALAVAQADLTSALETANTNFKESMKTIGEDFAESIKGFKSQLASYASSIRAIAAEIAAAKAAMAAPVPSAPSSSNANIDRGLQNRSPTGRIPGLASGGFVNSPVNAIIGEAGPEVVMPLDRFEKVMGLSNAGQSKTINYYAAPNQSLDAEQSLFQAMRRAKVVAAW